MRGGCCCLLVVLATWKRTARKAEVIMRQFSRMMARWVMVMADVIERVDLYYRMYLFSLAAGDGFTPPWSKRWWWSMVMLDVGREKKKDGCDDSNDALDSTCNMPIFQYYFYLVPPAAPATNTKNCYPDLSIVQHCINLLRTPMNRRNPANFSNFKFLPTTSTSWLKRQRREREKQGGGAIGEGWCCLQKASWDGNKFTVPDLKVIVRFVYQIKDNEIVSRRSLAQR